MELKRTRDWSDFDSKDGSNAKSKEVSKQPPPEAIPERPAPLLDLGIIFNRRDMPKETLKSVSEEYDHVAPEVAQGLTLGSTPELSRITGAAATQKAQLEASKAQAALAEEDDESESSEEKEDTTASVPATPIRPQQPVSSRPDTTDFISSVAERPQAVLPARAVDMKYYSMPTTPPVVEAPAFQAMPPVAENLPYPPIVLEQTPVQPNIPAQPAESVPPAVAGGGGGNLPPPPNRFAQAEYPEPQPWRASDAAPAYPQPSFNAYNYLLAASNVLSMVGRRTFETSEADMRRRFAAKLILAVALTWYLTRRPIKPLRKQVSALQETTAQQNEQISQLTYEQQAAQQRIAEQQRQIDQFTQPQAVSFAQEFAPAPVVAPQPIEHIKALPAFAEQPEIANQQQDLEASYSAVFDAHNRPVAEAVPSGQEYQQDRSHELVGARDARFTPAAGSAGGYGQPMAGSSSTPTLPSGQVVPAYMLPMNDFGQTPSQEAQHLLNAPKPSPVVSALISPWLWLGVGILLIAFFVAATI